MKINKKPFILGAFHAAVQILIQPPLFFLAQSLITTAGLNDEQLFDPPAPLSTLSKYHRLESGSDICCLFLC